MLTVVLLGASPLAGSLASGCGSSAQQDASEPKGTFAVRVTHASFPARQSVAREEQLVLSVRNTSTHAVPNVAVAVNSFDYISSYSNLAARKRPVAAHNRPAAADSTPAADNRPGRRTENRTR